MPIKITPLSFTQLAVNVLPVSMIPAQRYLDSVGVPLSDPLAIPILLNHTSGNCNLSVSHVLTFECLATRHFVLTFVIEVTDEQSVNDWSYDTYSVTWSKVQISKDKVTHFLTGNLDDWRTNIVANCSPGSPISRYVANSVHLMLEATRFASLLANYRKRGLPDGTFTLEPV